MVKETPTTLVVDAHDGMGMVASYKAMKSIIEKAKKNGLAMAAIRNSTHYGIAGYWTSMAVNEGLIGISGTNARPSTAPTFGVENMLGTNPLTFGMPTDEEFHLRWTAPRASASAARSSITQEMARTRPRAWSSGATAKP